MSMIGKTLGNFEITSRLGKGGIFGEAEHSRRLFDNFLRGAENCRRRLENNFRF
jgi:hypothetical protein